MLKASLRYVVDILHVFHPWLMPHISPSKLKALFYSIWIDLGLMFSCFLDLVVVHMLIVYTQCMHALFVFPPVLWVSKASVWKHEIGRLMKKCHYFNSRLLVFCLPFVLSKEWITGWSVSRFSLPLLKSENEKRAERFPIFFFQFENRNRMTTKYEIRLKVNRIRN